MGQSRRLPPRFFAGSIYGSTCMFVATEGERKRESTLDAIAGRPLRGVVWFEVAEPLIMIRSLFVKFAGKSFMDGRKERLVKEVQGLLSIPVGERLTLRKGLHAFPFYIPVPKGVPTSTSTPELRVQYTLKCEADVVDKDDFLQRLGVHVLSLKDTVHGKVEDETVHHTKTTPIGATGPLDMTVKCRSWYRIGEDIELWITLDNRCGRHVKSVDVELVREKELRKRKLTTPDRTTLFKWSKKLNPTAYTNTRVDAFVVAEQSDMRSEVDPSFLTEQFELRYLLRVTADVPGARDVSLKIPVKLLLPVPRSVVTVPAFQADFSRAYGAAPPTGTSLYSIASSASGKSQPFDENAVSAQSPLYTDAPTVPWAYEVPQPGSGPAAHASLRLGGHSGAFVMPRGAWEQLKAAPYPRSVLPPPGGATANPVPSVKHQGQWFTVAAARANPASDDGTINDDDLNRSNCVMAGSALELDLVLRVVEPYRVLESATCTFAGAMRYVSRKQRLVHITRKLVSTPRVLRRGVHRIPFAVQLPEGLPSSMYHAVLIEYCLRMRLRFHGTEEPQSLTLPLVVVSPVHLPENAAAPPPTAPGAAPVSSTVTNSVEITLPDEGGALAIIASIPKAMWTQQETIPITVEVSNESHLYVSEAEVSLRVQSSLHPLEMLPPRERRSFGVLARRTQMLAPRVYARSNCTAVLVLPLDRMPQVVDPSFYFSPLLWAAYELRISLSVPGSTELAVTLPVTILPHDPRKLRSALVAPAPDSIPELVDPFTLDSESLALWLERAGGEAARDAAARVREFRVAGTDLRQNLHAGALERLLEGVPATVLHRLRRDLLERTFATRVAAESRVSDVETWLRPQMVDDVLEVEQMVKQNAAAASPSTGASAHILLQPKTFGIPLSYIECLRLARYLRAKQEECGADPLKWFGLPKLDDTIVVPEDIMFLCHERVSGSAVATAAASTAAPPPAEDAAVHETAAEDA